MNNKKQRKERIIKYKPSKDDAALVCRYCKSTEKDCYHQVDEKKARVIYTVFCANCGNVNYQISHDFEN